MRTPGFHASWSDNAFFSSFSIPPPQKSRVVQRIPNCNEQIPAKAYEYLRANWPILTLTDPAGDTASTLRQAGATDIVRLDSVEDICAALPSFIAADREGRAALPDPGAVHAASREGRTEVLATLLEKVTGSPQ